MHWNITGAEYLDGYRLRLSFTDGKSGVVDFDKYIRRGGVFARLADLRFFKDFHINSEFGTLCWGDDLDVAPETLYLEAVGDRASAVAESRASYGPKGK
jgi:hypothetical protein